MYVVVVRVVPRGGKSSGHSNGFGKSLVVGCFSRCGRNVGRGFIITGCGVGRGEGTSMPPFPLPLPFPLPFQLPLPFPLSFQFLFPLQSLEERRIL
jgi:hypothetical protein